MTKLPLSLVLIQKPSAIPPRVCIPGVGPSAQELALLVVASWVQQCLQHLQLLIGHLCDQGQVGKLLKINIDTRPGRETPKNQHRYFAIATQPPPPPPSCIHITGQHPLHHHCGLQPQGNLSMMSTAQTISLVHGSSHSTGRAAASSCLKYYPSWQLNKVV